MIAPDSVADDDKRWELTSYLYAMSDELLDLSRSLSAFDPPIDKAIQYDRVMDDVTLSIAYLRDQWRTIDACLMTISQGKG